MTKPRRSFVTFVSSVISSIFGRLNILHLPTRHSWLKSGIPLGVFPLWLSTRLKLGCCRSGFQTQSFTPLASVARFKAPLLVRPGVEAQKHFSRWQSVMCRIRIRHLAPPPSAPSSHHLLAAPPRATSTRHLLAPPPRDGRTRLKLAAVQSCETDIDHVFGGHSMSTSNTSQTRRM